jgi:23S rRNA (adenine2503-C2)-methyltransferase
MKIDIKSMTLEEITKDFLSLGLKKYRAEQTFRWISSGAVSFSEMSDLPKDLRDFLDSRYKIPKSSIVKKEVSCDGTSKFAIMFEDGSVVESVVMKYKFGNSICVSTQVGCRMRCKFCANSNLSFSRNLLPSEILSQVHVISKSENLAFSNITLMGVGEPFDNYENVLKFIDIATSQKGMNIGSRRISVSTCGLADKIKMFADEKIGVTLSVSLHSVKDETRNDIMPINRAYNLEKLRDSCKYYNDKTNKRISFEYIVLKNVNDSKEDAYLLAKFLKGLIFHINLIPANNTGGKLISPSLEKVHIFAKWLIDLGINVTVRRTLGSDISASCGQLRAKVIK